MNEEDRELTFFLKEEEMIGHQIGVKNFSI